MLKHRLRVHKRLEREIHTWSHFDHENIVELLATCTDFNARSELNFKCLVMEYCEKGDMKTVGHPDILTELELIRDINYPLN